MVVVQNQLVVGSNTTSDSNVSQVSTHEGRVYREIPKSGIVAGANKGLIISLSFLAATVSAVAIGLLAGFFINPFLGVGAAVITFFAIFAPTCLCFAEAGALSPSYSSFGIEPQKDPQPRPWH